MAIPGSTVAEAFFNLQRLAALVRSGLDTSLVMAFGAIGWPWLLKSLSGGSAEERDALLAKIGLPQEALPPLGSWRADARFLRLIADFILEAKPRTVVDFGGGTTSLVAAQCLRLNGSGSMISFDARADFAASTAALLAAQGLKADIRVAPLITAPSGWPGQWYDYGQLPDPIDLLIVDGPPWFLHPLGRGAAASLFDRIAPGGAVMLDDAARPGERIVAWRWRREWPDFDFDYVPGKAGTLIGRRK